MNSSEHSDSLLDESWVNLDSKLDDEGTSLTHISKDEPKNTADSDDAQGHLPSRSLTACAAVICGAVLFYLLVVLGDDGTATAVSHNSGSGTHSGAAPDGSRLRVDQAILHFEKEKFAAKQKVQC